MSGYGMMLCLRGFPLVVLGSQPFRVMLEIFFMFFLLCFVGHRAVYGRIQSLISGKGRSSRPIDRGALIWRVACRKSCRNLKRGERFDIGNPR